MTSGSKRLQSSRDSGPATAVWQAGVRRKMHAKVLIKFLSLIKTLAANSAELQLKGDISLAGS